MDLNSRKQYYEYLKEKRINAINEKFYNYNKKACKHEIDLIILLKNKKNFMHLLTPLQQKIIKAWEFNNYNTNLTDLQLKLSQGYTYHTLFGWKKNNTTYGGIYNKIKGLK